MQYSVMIGGLGGNLSYLLVQTHVRANNPQEAEKLAVEQCGKIQDVKIYNPSLCILCGREMAIMKEEENDLNGCSFLVTDDRFVRIQ